MWYRALLTATLVLAATACSSSDAPPSTVEPGPTVVTGPPVIPPVTGDAPALPSASLPKVKALAETLQVVDGVPALTFSPEPVPVDDCGVDGAGQRTVYQYTGQGDALFLPALAKTLDVKPLQNGQALADENGVIVPVARFGFDKDGIGVVVQVSSSGSIVVNLGPPCAANS